MSIRANFFAGKRRLIAIGLSVTTILAVIVVVAVMAIGPRTALGSGTGGGGCVATGTAPACTFQNNNAYAYFDNVSSDGCIYTNVGVSLYDSLTVPGQTAKQTALIFIEKYNDCTYVPLMEAGSYDPNTGLSTFTGDIQLASDMSRATVTGTAAMYDWSNGWPTQPSFTTSVSLTFKGYGSTSRYSDSQHYHSSGFVMNTHFTGTSRPAEVSGTLTDDAGNNVATVPSTFAELTNSSGGTVQIFH